IIAFSDQNYLDANPDPALRVYFDSEVPDMRTRSELQREIAAAGFHTIAQRVLPNASWEAYYTPQAQRITMLRAAADAALTQVLDEAESEIAMWRRYSDQFGYVLSVVRPT
ncbi:MAG: class I SAM-dependent methyltransferase, partial [Boseongicola sp.]